VLPGPGPAAMVSGITRCPKGAFDVIFRVLFRSAADGSDEFHHDDKNYCEMKKHPILLLLGIQLGGYKTTY